MLISIPHTDSSQVKYNKIRDFVLVSNATNKQTSKYTHTQKKDSKPGLEDGVTETFLKFHQTLEILYKIYKF